MGRRSDRRPVLVAVLLAFMLGAVVAGVGVPAPGPAVAAPGDGEERDDEGGTPTLRGALESAAREYLESEAALESSRKRQKQLSADLTRSEKQLKVLAGEISVMASNAYRTGRLGTVAALLNSVSSEEFLQRAVMVETISLREDQQLRIYTELHDRVTAQKAKVDAEVATQKKESARLAKAKKAAERALGTFGGTPRGGFLNPNSPLAQPAPRTADGGWPREYCTVDDPTTGGCITPRLNHAYQEARKAGFKRYTACKRGGSFGEHPLGRACDFAAQAGGFGGVATGGDRTYGNNLASFFVKNASRLGVLYVIWFRQIWFPGQGWGPYSGGGGDPSSDHTNHVHLSVL